MFRSIKNETWVFDCEWVPDPLVGRVLYKLDESLSDAEVIKVMREKGGATKENPKPFLKLVLCRIVSISAVIRKVKSNGETTLHLLSLPKDVDDPNQVSEKNIIETFLNAIGDKKPQLVGYNSIGSDLKILLQRALVHGLQIPSFFERPDKPWIDEPGYIENASTDWNVDLMKIIGGGKSSFPSLDELAVACGIPGKFHTDGMEVAEIWLDGRLQEIVNYSEHDVLTTYLIWLRLAHLAGLFDSEKYKSEQKSVAELIKDLGEKPENSHLKKYLKVWLQLRKSMQS
ncbi:MAG: hypothetical protein DWQ06_10435 [Calditrichaeota bacterium]|nr:MAG: hypothetical protein DWQ06_10435 [Calditrichota bacterium]